MIKQIEPIELKELLDQDNVVLFDVREFDEYRQRHILGSVLNPSSNFNADQILSETKPVVVYCKSGGRSSYACEDILKKNPSFEIFNLKGGILAWIEQGFEFQENTPF